ncbi:spore coat U domain-containing protein [Psychrobacter frigidicola]|uniref:Csu type fimbrial protein n=1 Tax=Psychrobacter frigidicola TaxID=45611 RepID=UPI00191B13D7|nr:spore coat protein U domain-containing protein [Psychrobacter frigidicola]
MKPLKVKLFQWRYGLFLLPVVLWSPVNSAQADITCTASMNSGTVNIDNAITPVNADNKAITGNLNYSCTNNGTSPAYASVHLGIDDGDSATLNPHYMSGPNSSKLAFTMTLPNGALWGNGNGSGSEYHPDPFLISPSEMITRSVVIKTTLLFGYHNAYATEGVHVNNSYITLTYDSATDNTARLNYRNGDQGAIQFPFTVQATVVSSCLINSASNIDLGSQPANLTNITGYNSVINVTCTNDALYNIGLSPSNDNADGEGVMTETPSDSYGVPYQLRSTSGVGGTIWGNTATSDNVGNGVAGTGSGAPKSHTVYVTVPSADFKPGNYSDIVTISVNY